MNVTAKRSEKARRFGQGKSLSGATVWLGAIGIFGLFDWAEAQAISDDGRPLLEAQVGSSAATPRSRSPIPLIVTLIWNGEGLLEGRLEYFVRQEKKWGEVNRHSTAPLVVTGGNPNRIRLMLPPVTGGMADLTPTRSLELQFVGRGGQKYDLRSHYIAPGSPHKHSFNICVSWSKVNSGLVMTGPQRVFWSGFRFEELCSKLVFPFDLADGGFDTHPALVAPNELPSSAIEFCAYDILLLQEGFVDLKSRQKEAIMKWVRAGGCLILATPDGKLEDTNAFLKEISASQAILNPDEDGGSALPLPVHYELGRVLALPPEFDPAKQSAERMVKILGFVWKIPSGTLEELEERLADKAGRPDAVTTPNGVEVSPFPRVEYGVDAELAALEFNAALFESLMPRGIRAIPTVWIVGVIACFILVIGPIDYLLLGKMNKRILTWVFYPLAAIASTGVIMRQTEKSFSDSSKGGRFAVIDIGSDSAALAETVLQLHFSARHSVMELSAKQALISDVLTGVKGETIGNYSSWSVTGAYPTNYQARRALAQWSPVLARTYRIGAPSVELPAMDWTKLNPLTFRSVGSPADAVCEEAERVLPGDVAAVVWHQGRRSMCADDDTLGRLPISSILDQLVVFSSSDEHAGIARPTWGPVSRSLLAESKQGHSPSGSHASEDLRFADVKDPTATTIFIIQRLGNHFNVFRRIFRTTRLAPL